MRTPPYFLEIPEKQESSITEYSNKLHINDRKRLAENLGISLERFDSLLDSANKAYDYLKSKGPFYGKEDVKEPTFRITAEPVILPEGTKELFEKIGQDLLRVGRVLQKLPKKYKIKLGDDLDFKHPPTWRIDAIMDTKGNFRINEIECVDSASSLMIAQQIAYGLQTLAKSTAARLVHAFKDICSNGKDKKLKLALIRNSVNLNPHTANHKRLIEFVEELSEGSIKIDMIDDDELRRENMKLNFKKYNGVLNETSLSPSDLKKLGVEDNLLISAGNYNAINNKGVFALIFDEALKDFWLKNIGEERLERLRNVLIPSKFIENQKELEDARRNGKVVKVSWAGANTILINRSKGVALPDKSIKHGSNERWDMLKDLLNNGVKMIAQDFVLPTKIDTFLRKKGTSLERVNWYNRICIKYVSMGNPNLEQIPHIELTAAEVTLGPEIVPAGRACAFTAAFIR